MVQLPEKYMDDTETLPGIWMLKSTPVFKPVLWHSLLPPVSVEIKGIGSSFEAHGNVSVDEILSRSGRPAEALPLEFQLNSALIFTEKSH